MVSREIEKALFDAAVVIEDHTVRSAFLDEACAGDSAKRRRISNLLEASEGADDFFRVAEDARTMVAAGVCDEFSEFSNEDAEDSEAEGPGSRIGRYQIVQRIGEGGCGIVYLAEQQEPVQRLVALKVIRLGMDTERVIARFEMERQALAVMDHPNIAHVLDAGATDTGRPYFVMELVRGVRITDYCNEKRLDIRQRIDLFIKVCNAIQHAHQKGLIHRDIKPSNILIAMHDGKPTPKVIDFGIAKATDGNSVGETMLTSNEPFVGTPAYMSPEQADRRGMDVDTRSDVYGLGMLLYELLAGRTPFDPKELAAMGVTEMRQVLLELEPPAPSSLLLSLDADAMHLVAEAFRLEPSRLVSSIRGDLDWVVMKAIEKDRQRRYETVNGLAMDLKRFIDNEPVIARPPGRIYLFRKFVRRNRFAVATVAGITGALSLGLGLACSSYLSEREARREQVRLKNIAEAARANEQRLRQNAITRENIAQVAVLLSEGKTEAADALLRQTPVASIEPSMEATTVLRSLGGWNAMRGRWQEASDCFLLLTQASKLFSAEAILSSNDLVCCGATLAENESKDGYQQYREWILTRFGDTNNIHAAQQVLQSSLLLPADASFYTQIEPLRILLEKTNFSPNTLKPGWETESAAWRAWSLSLLEYRRGDYAKSLYWVDVAVGLKPTKAALVNVIHLMRAKAQFRYGNVDVSRAELDLARKSLDVVFKPELPPVYEPAGKNQGFWWDWVQARILLHEAETLIAPASQ